METLIKKNGFNIAVKAVFVLIILSNLNNNCFAKVLPENGASLNFTHVMFQYNQVEGANKYKVLVFERDKTDQPPVATAESNSLAVLIKEGLNFGKYYIWHTEAYSNNKLIQKSDNSAFAIAYSYLIDSSLFRYNISKSESLTLQNNLVFIENLGVAINQNGKPVWYLPVGVLAERKEMHYRNIEITHNGTFTYILNDDCFETNIYGDILWQGPKNGQVSQEASEYFHHDFTKLKDGTYMVCGYKFVQESNPLNPANFSRVRYNTLLQYNAAGKVIWWWSDKQAFAKSTIFANATADEKETPGTHMNSLFYDEKDDAFLLSFRNISRIIKIDKKTGKNIYQLGRSDEKTSDTLSPCNAVFSKQHSVTLLNSNILFYNNNTDVEKGKPSFPHIVIMSQPTSKKPSKVIWDYECKTPQFPDGLQGKEGYATALPNKNILVCMGGENRIFEVTKDKKIVWECLSEKLNVTENTWSPFSNYRAHFASSLYPQYFTVMNHAINKPSIKASDNFDLLTVYNNGSENDTYKVVFSSTKGYMQKKEITITIKAGEQQLIKTKLNIQQSKTISDELTVSIFPFNNPSMVETFTFNVQGSK